MRKLYSYGPLKAGDLVKRYKRFLADVRLEDGKTVTAFCPNSGSMMGLREPGLPVLISPASDPARKTRFTLEAVRVGRTWVGVNTHLTNQLAGEVIQRGLGGGLLKGCTIIRPEVTIGNSRLDYLLEDEQGREVYMEVKSSTLRKGHEAQFPDAVTTRGLKHLHELVRITRDGGRAALMFMVQRADCRCFSPANAIDPEYGKALRAAIRAGVHVEAHMHAVRRDGIYYKCAIPLCPSLLSKAKRGRL